MEIDCPSCGTDEHLDGERGDDDIIHITCRACGAEWDRDPNPTCPTCGNHDVRGVPQVIVDKARGTQLSVTGFRMVYLCPDCDRELWDDYKQTNAPMGAAELPHDRE